MNMKNFSLVDVEPSGHMSPIYPRSFGYMAKNFINLIIKVCAQFV